MTNAATLFEKWDQIPSVPVWIASPTVKRGGRKDIREFLAKSVGDGDTRTFIFDDTIRDFVRANFTLDVGCELNDGTGYYRCVQVIPYKPKKKIYPMLITTRIS